MHIHVPHRPTWGVLLAITVVALWLGSFEFLTLIQSLGARSLPIAKGRILQREEISRWGGLPLAKLTIREATRGDTVLAVMHNHIADKFSGLVEFHYAGDPREEVQIGEDNPLWLVSFTWGLPLLLWVIYFKLRRSPRYRSMVD
jgi:hypothetical protein